MQEKKKRILREMAGEQSEMEAMLQVERDKIKKTRLDNPRTIQVKRYAKNFSSSNKVGALDISDRETLNKYAALLNRERVGVQDKQHRMLMIERI